MAVIFRATKDFSRGREKFAAGDFIPRARHWIDLRWHQRRGLLERVDLTEVPLDPRPVTASVTRKPTKKRKRK